MTGAKRSVIWGLSCGVVAYAVGVLLGLGQTLATGGAVVWGASIGFCHRRWRQATPPAAPDPDPDPEQDPRLDRRLNRLWAGVGLLPFAAAFLYVMQFFAYLEFDEWCAHGLAYDGAPLRETHTRPVPLQMTCTFEDGATRTAVPLWLTVLFLAVVAAWLSCVVLVTRGERAARARAV